MPLKIDWSFEQTWNSPMLSWKTSVTYLELDMALYWKHSMEAMAYVQYQQVLATHYWEKNGASASRETLLFSACVTRKHLTQELNIYFRLIGGINLALENMLTFPGYSLWSEFQQGQLEERTVAAASSGLKKNTLRAQTGIVAGTKFCISI
jgi:hypothetical protein